MSEIILVSAEDSVQSPRGRNDSNWQLYESSVAKVLMLQAAVAAVEAKVAVHYATTSAGATYTRTPAKIVYDDTH